MWEILSYLSNTVSKSVLHFKDKAAIDIFFYFSNLKVKNKVDFISYEFGRKTEKIQKFREKEKNLLIFDQSICNICREFSLFL